MNTTNNPINQYCQFSKIFLSLFICLFAYLFICLFPTNTLGDTVSNQNYSIDVDTIDTNPQPTPRSQVIDKKNIKTNDFTTGPNYTIISPKSYLSIGVSQNLIDYGILTSTNPVIRTSELFLSNNGLGADILTYENHPLSANPKDVIQNTSCDNGSCTPEIAALWNNTLTYGFGYRCDSSVENFCDSQFTQSNYFKPYPDNSLGHTSEAILFSNPGDAKANVTYKVNISGTQRPGGYYNSITYLAIPNF